MTLLRQKGRGTEVLRCGAQTPSSRLRGYRRGLSTRSVLCPRRRTLGASPHSVGIYSQAFSSVTLALLALLLTFSLPSHAQTPSAPAAPIITGPPRVLILVYQQPGAADQVSITYDPKVSQAQAAADMDALTQATGWLISSRSITEAASPLTNRPGAMTSVTFAVPGVVQDATHTFPVEALARVFRRYKRLNAVFIVGPQFGFQGARWYADNDIKFVLDQHDTSYVYQIEVLSQNFSRLPLVPVAGTAAAHKSPWRVLLGILGAAALAGFIVYSLMSLLPQSKPKLNTTDAEAETRLEAGTRK